MKDVEYMDPEEARELGVIQEVNRQILHPCGLALTVLADDDGSIVEVAGIIDNRETCDNEGMVFDEVDEEKVNKFHKMQTRFVSDRAEKFGWVIQPPNEDLQ